MAPPGEDLTMRKNDCTSNGSPGPDILCVWERMHRLVSGGEYGGAASEARTRTRAETRARSLARADWNENERAHLRLVPYLGAVD